MVTCFSSNDFFFNFREAWLKVILHESFGLFLVLFTLCHDHFQNVLLVVDQGVLPELCSDSLTCFNIRTYDIITV